MPPKTADKKRKFNSIVPTPQDAPKKTQTDTNQGEKTSEKQTTEHSVNEGKKEEEKPKTASQEPQNSAPNKNATFKETEPTGENKPNDQSKEQQSSSDKKDEKGEKSKIENPNNDFPQRTPDLEKLQTAEKPTETDAQDIGTPDDWIPRNPDLIRLTGRHPLNAEPPVIKLLEYGFFTPTSLHYVRCHGSVPKLDWNSHRLLVEGVKIEGQRSFSMDELKALSNPLTIAVTITCDGNRRKEVNMINRTKGFNWGPGGISTGVWTGVRLREILKACGIRKLSEDETAGLHVWFEGADTLAFGIYGTSIPLSVAMNKTNDIIVAYELNGSHLTPDHGHPIRLVIPGYIGGRQVKWLKKIIISTKSSDNYYHINDNRVLPSNINEANAATSGWFQKEETLLNEANVNSVIVYPEHEEWLNLDDSRRTYTVRGFANTGGGKSIVRVELTLDNGKSWIICEHFYPDLPLRHGNKRWTWCFWKVELPIWRFLNCEKMSVRAVDTSFSPQPKNITWNVLGMMNNSWYTLRVSIESNPHKPPSLTFKHPVLPGRTPGGWQQTASLSHESHVHLQRDSPTATGAQLFVGKYFTLDEIARHKTTDDCWVIIDSAVYDITPYVKEHPGGSAPLLLYAGTDATMAFFDIHSMEAREQLHWYKIGVVVSSKIEHPSRWRNRKNAVVGPRKWTTVTVSEIEDLTHNTKKFKFALPGKDPRLWLPVGQHLLVSATINNELVVRPYTPIHPAFPEEDKGFIEFVIKIYEKGRLSRHFGELKKGDTLQLKGPAGPILYVGNGVFSIDQSTVHVRHVSLLAGGSGITPMVQLVEAILNDKNDKTHIKLLFANSTPGDVIMKPYIDDLANKSDKRFCVTYTVSKTNDQEWHGHIGRVSEHMIRDELFPPAFDTIALCCGPPAMVDSCEDNLRKFGYMDESIFEF